MRLPACISLYSDIEHPGGFVAAILFIGTHRADAVPALVQ
jgi:hypothetical protein